MYLIVLHRATLHFQVQILSVLQVYVQAIQKGLAADKSMMVRVSAGGRSSGRCPASRQQEQ
jgi:hypothetical protein